eukprot:CAMPEP_0172328846 /NCGR_PEP_ID=MMETSP1058-20130122/60565_1 /TAXON_ID=83371 /ORGANISM="Detonula confervacea, Strain CCMP 353" /LENGTH=637 /DNA_ID=CAMNT_0013045979 /DNA_START=121 /DNA_END=2034 /DNA_ORIENTATION=+
MNHRILEDTNKDDINNNIDKLLCQLTLPGDHASIMPLKASAVVKSRVNPERGASIDTINDCTAPPLTDMPILSSTYHSTLSTERADDDASTMSNVTLKLHTAAKKTIRLAKSKRAIHAAVPLEVNEAMLEKEFPHVWRSEAAKGDVDSTKTEYPSLDQVVDEREGRRAVNYNDCIETHPAAETLHLRNAMFDYERERMITMMESVSLQMNTYHELLDENLSLKQEVTQVKREKDEVEREKDNIVSELEKSLIEMKLTLAQCQGREDHHRLSMVRLQLDLKNAQDENHKLHQKPVIPERRRGSLLTKSLSSAESPNVRSDEPMKNKKSPLTRSWFGKEGKSCLDSSSRSEDNGRGLGASFLNQSFRRITEQHQKSPKDIEPPPPKLVVPPIRSRSFVDPKKAKALKESEFMPWNSESSLGSSLGSSFVNQSFRRITEPHRKSPEYIEPPSPKLVISHIRSRSFVDPKKARALKESEFMPWNSEPCLTKSNDDKAGRSVNFHEPIGSDVFLAHHRNVEFKEFDSRSTILSNITDITFEGGDTTVAEEAVNARFTNKIIDKESLLTKCNEDAMTASRGSYSTLEFEPAKPQLQKALSLREIQVMPNEMPQLQKRGGQHETPQLQKAASSAGDDNAYLAFC